MLLSFRLPVIAAALALAATGAHADVVISSGATQNMSCSAGVCAPTAASAVLNANDLETLLAAGNVEVTTTGSNVQATDIRVVAPLGWSSARVLALDSFRRIAVEKPVNVAGAGGVMLGAGGMLLLGERGHISFANLASPLTINGERYTLVDSISMLAGDIAANAKGYYALSRDYDASNDGNYHHSPIGNKFFGTFEGLGNTISNLKINVLRCCQEYNGNIGFFAVLGRRARVNDVNLTKATVQFEKGRPHRNAQVYVGVLAGFNVGKITRSTATGAVKAPVYTDYAAGLVGRNAGVIIDSSAGVTVTTKAFTAAGLVGFNNGKVDACYATGTVQSVGDAGGLVGESVGGERYGRVTNSYASGKTLGEYAGGLIGGNGGYASGSYSIGEVEGSTYAGGLIGVDASDGLNNTYWDTTTSGITNLSQGAGSPANDPGITGLTTQQLQSGLPSGFDPSIWAEDASINGGLPYLIANPPRN